MERLRPPPRRRVFVLRRRVHHGGVALPIRRLNLNTKLVTVLLLMKIKDASSIYDIHKHLVRKSFMEGSNQAFPHL